jgi:hypothetical protein
MDSTGWKRVAVVSGPAEVQPQRKNAASPVA